MSWRAQNRSKDAKIPSAGLAMSKKPEPGLCGPQPYSRGRREAAQLGRPVGCGLTAADLAQRPRRKSAKSPKPKSPCHLPHLPIANARFGFGLPVARCQLPRRVSRFGFFGYSGCCLCLCRDAGVANDQPRLSPISAPAAGPFPPQISPEGSPRVLPTQLGPAPAAALPRGGG
jgi:hypothetical protein